MKWDIHSERFLDGTATKVNVIDILKHNFVIAVWSIYWSMIWIDDMSEETPTKMALQNAT